MGCLLSGLQSVWQFQSLFTKRAFSLYYGKSSVVVNVEKTNKKMTNLSVGFEPSLKPLFDFDNDLIKYRPSFIALQLIIGPTTIVGSLIILILFYKSKQCSNTSSRKYFIGLATADLQTGIIFTRTLLLMATDGKLSDQSCVICITLAYYIGFASLFLLVGMTIDRYFAILHPLKYKMWYGGKSTYFVIFGCYVGGIGIGLLCYITRKDVSGKSNILCFVSSEVVNDTFCFTCICAIVIPCTIIFLYSYVKIFRVIMNSVRN